LCPKFRGFVREERLMAAADSPKKKIEKLEQFFAQKEKLAEAFEKGEDAVAVALGSLNETEEVVES
jgi:hypothetical protein